MDLSDLATFLFLRQLLQSLQQILPTAEPAEEEDDMMMIPKTPAT